MTRGKTAWALIALSVVSGCTINAQAPITNNVQANTQVDQRSGTFGPGTGQAQSASQSEGTPVEPQQVGSPGQIGIQPTVAPTTGPTIRPLVFAGVKQFNLDCVYAVDFNTIIVSERNTLHITTDAGVTWSKYENIGAGAIQAMYWLNGQLGWVGGSDGNLLKVTLQDGQVTTEVQDSMTSRHIKDIYFLSASEGFIADASGTIRRTHDGGANWGEDIKPHPANMNEADAQRFHRRDENTFYYEVMLLDYAVPASMSFQYRDGAFEPLVGKDKPYSKIAPSGSTLYLSQQMDARHFTDGTWFSTTDLTDVKQIGPGIKTSV